MIRALAMLLALVPLTLVSLAVAQSKKAPPGELARDLAPPVRLEAGGKIIDTDIGHAAPFVGDFDGDGVNDLLVGQFGEGILWIYKNVGTGSQPKLAPGVKFKDGSKDGRVPTG